MGVPDSLCEAARIDGMSEYGIYAKIMLPLSKPAIATLTIFTFVSTWNDYLGPLIYLKTQEKKTIQLGLKMFISQYSSEYGLNCWLCNFIDTCTGSILMLAKIFCRGHSIYWYKGLAVDYPSLSCKLYLLVLLIKNTVKNKAFVGFFSIVHLIKSSQLCTTSLIKIQSLRNCHSIKSIVHNKVGAMRFHSTIHLSYNWYVNISFLLIYYF